MTPASERLAERIASIDVVMPSIPVLHNCNVEIATSAEQVAANLVTQLDSPVRWVESINKMHEQGVDTFIESGPGKVLGGMVKRIVKGVNVACIDSPDALEGLL